MWHPVLMNDLVTLGDTAESTVEWCGSFKHQISTSYVGGYTTEKATLWQIIVATRAQIVTYNLGYFAGLTPSLTAMTNATMPTAWTGFYPKYPATQAGWNAYIQCAMTQAEFNAAFNAYSQLGGIWGDLWREFSQNEGALYRGSKYIENHQPAGMYTVAATAYTVSGAAATPLCNQFEFLPMLSLIADFDASHMGSLSYGSSLPINQWVTQHGDRIMLVGDDNPTVWNSGNVKMTLNVQQNDMGFGFDDDSNGFLTWDVAYRAQMGDTSGLLGQGPLMSYFPDNLIDDDNDVNTPLAHPKSPNILPWNVNLGLTLYPCHPEKINFHIMVLKALVTSYSGHMILTPAMVPYVPCYTDVSQGTTHPNPCTGTSHAAGQLVILACP
jgi:hypothetical protein